MLTEWFRFNALEQPSWLFALLLVPVVAAVEYLAPAASMLRVSTGETIAQIARDEFDGWRFVPPSLRAVGLSLLIVALAGPLYGYQVRRDRANVIDVMLCVDVSGSMGEKDFYAGGQRRDRLYVTKAAVRDFIASRKERQTDRYGLDRVGLVLYAGIAWTQCPLTLDYAILERELEAARIDNAERKEGTAIGSALGLAVSRLRDSEAKSKVIILLTDGINNRGELDPITAAQLAQDFGIRVYTIGAGAVNRGGVPSLFGMTRGSNQGIDEETLLRIANTTGGKYFRAIDTDSLQEAYADINELETTEIEVGDYYEYNNNFAPYALLGGLSILASIAIRRQRVEAIP